MRMSNGMGGRTSDLRCAALHPVGEDLARVSGISQNTTKAARRPEFSSGGGRNPGFIKVSCELEQTDAISQILGEDFCDDGSFGFFRPDPRRIPWTLWI